MYAEGFYFWQWLYISITVLFGRWSGQVRNQEKIVEGDETQFAYLKLHLLVIFCSVVCLSFDFTSYTLLLLPLDLLETLLHHLPDLRLVNQLMDTLQNYFINFVWM